MKKQAKSDDDRYREVIEQNGVRTEIWRDRDGNVVDIIKRIKQEEDPRTGGPKGNEQRQPA
jgi:hypothetical protein